MKFFVVVFSFVLLTSCDYFSKQKVDANDILKEELQTINWNDVDEYPSFDSCDSVTAQNKKNCFENTLLSFVNSSLSKQNIVVTDDIDDTIMVTILIDQKGDLSINDIEISRHTKIHIPKIDSLLIHSFDSLPKIYPAIKRSQQVATQFKFPIKIRIN